MVENGIEILVINFNNIVVIVLFINYNVIISGVGSDS